MLDTDHAGLNSSGWKALIDRQSLTKRQTPNQVEPSQTKTKPSRTKNHVKTSQKQTEQKREFG